MIPFNHLGWFFKYLGPVAYPKGVIKSLCDFLRPVTENALLLDLDSGTGVLGEFAHSCRNDLEIGALDPAEGMLRYVRTPRGQCRGIAF